MTGQTLNDRVWRALGAAARATGGQADAYRPTDGGDPVRQKNRFLRLPAAFTLPRLRTAHAERYGELLWDGVFDAAYTRPGDYLLHADGGIWFVASQPRMQPPLCVRTRRRVSFSRATAPIGAGANLYGGVDSGTAIGLLDSWPAAMSATGDSGQSALATAGEVRQGRWSVLLPPLQWLGLLAGDTLTDDLGRAGVIESADCTELGWRLLVRQSTA